MLLRFSSPQPYNPPALSSYSSCWFGQPLHKPPFRAFSTLNSSLCSCKDSVASLFFSGDRTPATGLAAGPFTP